MKHLLLSSTTGGLFFFSFTFLTAQEVADSAITRATPASAAEQVAEATCASSERSSFWLWRDAQVTGGQITLPFKIRRSPAHNTFRLTTDVTLGGYVGYTRRLSPKRDFYLTIPLTAGLTFINLNDNNTSLDRLETGAEVVPGLTWSTGMIFQMEKYSLGLLCGKDYASDVGNQWEYHGKMWWSFGIGFVFLQ